MNCAIELRIVDGIIPGTAHWNDRESSAGKILFEHRHHRIAVSGRLILGHGGVEVSGTINDEGFTMLLKRLFLENGDGGGDTVPVVFTPENANPRIGRQLQIDFADGCEK